MTCRRKKVRQAAEEAAELVTEEAIEHGNNAIEEVVSFVVPRAQHAGQQVADFVIPVYEDASKRVAPALAEAREKVAPALSDAREKVAPALSEAREKVAPALSEARDRVAPALAEARELIVPLVEEAYENVSEKVQHDVYPKLHDLWEHATENPTVAEASRRGRSAMAALKGDLELPEIVLVEPKRRRGVVGKIFTVLGIAALIAAIVVAIRAVLGSSDDGWSPAEPMQPSNDEEADWGDNPFADDVVAEPDVDTVAPTSSVEAEAAMVAEGGPVVAEPVEDEAVVEEAPEPAQRAENPYGEGAYVGSEPPEGYTIKGNERSMKYHTTEAAGYERTNADVWFNSEEAAHAAGFTRALR